ncbi:glutathione S-transferase [Rhizobium sp. BK275]|uniref:glutathione S-transferase family protein n=1 Tax=unclassified Rhizobium TaxID=2613769 RepID=UPI00161EE2D7|nr:MULTISPECIES: glutathione S-transferase family protein [unclassified Rhizobium]MBB3392540.1 glutathione S-transferase [Rhizobium sp. BK275]MBB3408782.1 glutathione S-transferase [Rhizobium sp. BK316]
MLTIYGVYRSRSARVYWMVEELGIEFQSVPVLQARRLANPLSPEAPINTLSPEFLAINPMALIPAIKDGDLVLNESLAINLYLARKYGGELGGKTVEEDGLMTMWTVWAVSELDGNTGKIVSTYDDGKQNTEAGRAVIDVACRTMKRPLSVLEKHLDGKDWIVGGRFTVADLNIAEVLRYAQSETALFEAHPNIDAWIKRCQSRPAYLEMQRKRSLEPVEV